MIGVYDVLTWLKRSPVYPELFEHGYCGKLDNKPHKALGVYPLRQRGQPRRAYSGLESYDTVGVSLLIHYNYNVEESQYAACKLFEFLRRPFPWGDLTQITDTDLSEAYSRDSEKATREIKLINLTVPEPVFVGTDDSGVYEFVIEFELYVEKEKDNA